MLLALGVCLAGIVASVTFLPLWARLGLSIASFALCMVWGALVTAAGPGGPWRQGALALGSAGTLALGLAAIWLIRPGVLRRFTGGERFLLSAGLFCVVLFVVARVVRAMTGQTWSTALARSAKPPAQPHSEQFVRSAVAGRAELPELIEATRSASLSGEQLDFIMISIARSAAVTPDDVPELLRVASHPSAGKATEAFIVQALAHLGAPAVAALTEALGAADERTWRVAAWALGQIGAPARAALDALKQRLERCEAGTRSREVVANAIQLIDQQGR